MRLVSTLAQSEENMLRLRIPAFDREARSLCTAKVTVTVRLFRSSFLRYNESRPA